MTAQRFILASALVALGAATAAAPAAAAPIGGTTTQDERTAGDHLCSLREAIDTVNSPPGNGDCTVPSGGANTIVLGAKRYKLGLPGAGTDNNAAGDLDVTSSIALTIRGAGARRTSIDATGLGDRVLDVQSGARVTLALLTVTGGHPP